jgi:SAM-dependent methyltransferase
MTLSTFINYARYYNLLYRDKDYVGEAQFVHQLLQTYAPKTQTILELGCGTGNHAILLAKMGYEIQGIDLSAEMLKQATASLHGMPQELISKLVFSYGDIRQINIGRQFDAIIALFHVISYQSTNEDLQDAFATAKTHLKPGGLFIFDCWYGPAVLSNRPSIRVKRIEDENINIIRVAEPAIYLNENTVDVHYQILIKDKNGGFVEEFNEVHRMRYLFKPEIKLLLTGAKMSFLECREWMTNRQPDFDTWGVYFVARG